MNRNTFDISKLVSHANDNALIYSFLILLSGLIIGGAIMIALARVGDIFVKNRKWSIAYWFCWTIVLVGITVGLVFLIALEAQSYHLQINTDVLEQIRIDVKQEFNIDLPTNYNDWIRFDDNVFPDWFKNNYWPNIIDTLIKYPIG